MSDGEVRIEVKVEVVDDAGKGTIVYGTAKVFGAAKVKEASEQALVYETLASALSGAGMNPNVIKPFKPKRVAEPPTPAPAKAVEPPTPAPPKPVVAPVPEAKAKPEGETRKAAPSKSKSSSSKAKPER